VSSRNAHRQESHIFIRSKNNWLGIALVVSITLHLAAAVLVMFAASSAQRTTEDALISILDINSPTASKDQAHEAVMRAPRPAPMPETGTATPVPEDTPTEPASADPAVPGDSKTLITSPLGLGMTFGYVTSLADGKTLRDDIRMYYFELVAKINQEWWKRAKTLREQMQHDGVIDIVLLRNGTLVVKKFRQGTGSREADRLFGEAIDAAVPLPHLPDSYELDIFTAPLRITAPSQLFRIGGT